MKNFVVFTLVLTLIFPAYCFSAPSGVPVREKSDKSIKEIIDAIKLIIEDGEVEEEEIAALLGDIEPSQNPFCEFFTISFYISLITLLTSYSTETLIFTIMIYSMTTAFCY